MRISLRGWFVLSAFVAAVAALAILGGPLLNPADAQSASRGQLSDRSLEHLLSAMSLKPEKQDKRFDFSFPEVHKGQEWNLSMSAVLSQDRKSIWVMAWLDEITRSAAEVPRSALLRLLSENDRLGNGKFFAYISSNRRFVLQRVIPNRSITIESFDEVLRDLGSSVVVTQPYWTVANWKNGGVVTSDVPRTANRAQPARQIRR